MCQIPCALRVWDTASTMWSEFPWNLYAVEETYKTNYSKTKQMWSQRGKNIGRNVSAEIRGCKTTVSWVPKGSVPAHTSEMSRATLKPGWCRWPSQATGTVPPLSRPGSLWSLHDWCDWGDWGGQWWLQAVVHCDSNPWGLTTVLPVQVGPEEVLRALLSHLLWVTSPFQRQFLRVHAQAWEKHSLFGIWKQSSVPPKHEMRTVEKWFPGN